MIKIRFLPLVIILIISCSNVSNKENHKNKIRDCNNAAESIITGSENLESYINLIKNKSVAIVTNQTGLIKGVHLVDTLISLDINIVKIFCPEHGFRGTADAGEIIDDNVDSKTGLPIISLYGNNRKPQNEQLSDVNIVLFDLQDVGVRFYTYISTLHYVMEACAENDIPVIVLDRPNPNSHYVDGPVLDTNQVTSFIGMHPVPVVYGMTIGEYAKMINGEGWLNNQIKCDLTVIPIKNYNHQIPYSLPVSPSPNLPNDRSIELYPSLCFFEGTTLSIGRGTTKQFQVVGHPLLKNSGYAEFSFTPKPSVGAQNPKLKGELCYGFDLSKDNSIFTIERNKLDVSIIIELYEMFPEKEKFFIDNNFFNLLAGNKKLKEQIINQIDETDIRNSWEPELSEFKEIRKKYLIY